MAATTFQHGLIDVNRQAVAPRSLHACLVTTKPYPITGPHDRALGVWLCNRTWELMRQATRSAADEDEMLNATHASRYHCSRVGQPVNLARASAPCPASARARYRALAEEASGAGADDNERDFVLKDIANLPA